MLWAYEQSCGFSFGILSNIPLFNFKKAPFDKMLILIKAPLEENSALPHHTLPLVYAHFCWYCKCVIAQADEHIEQHRQENRYLCTMTLML